MAGSGRRFADAPLTSVAAMLVAGLALVAADYWRTGLGLVALAVAVAAVLRLVLAAGDAGLLVVRSRAMDVTVLTVLALGVAVLAAVVPV